MPKSIYILNGRAREINWRYMDCTKKQKYSWSRTTTQWYIHTHMHIHKHNPVTYIHTYAHNIINVHARLADLVHTNPRSIVDTAYSEQWWVRVTRTIARSIHYSGWKEVIAVPFVHREFIKKRRRPRWSENVAITFERSIFNEIHTIHTCTLKCLLEPCLHCINQVCSSWCGNRHTHTHTQNDYRNPPAHVLRVNHQ